MGRADTPPARERRNIIAKNHGELTSSESLQTTPDFIICKARPREAGALNDLSFIDGNLKSQGWSAPKAHSSGKPGFSRSACLPPFCCFPSQVISLPWMRTQRSLPYNSNMGELERPAERRKVLCGQVYCMVLGEVLLSSSRREQRSFPDEESKAQRH